MNRRAARPLGIAMAAAAALGAFAAIGCSSSTDEPPAGSFVPVSARPSASAALPPTARVALPTTSSEAVVVPPTVKGVLPPGYAEGVLPLDVPMRVAVLTRGAEPRRALRYAFKPGAHRVTKLQVHPETTIDADQPKEMHLPDLAMSVDLAVAEREESTVHLAGKFLSVELASEVPEGVNRAPLEGALRAIEKLGFELDVDDRGLRSAFRVSESPDPGPLQLLERMRQGLASLVVPLPLEEIGIGATWQCVTRVQGNTPLIQFMTYTLKSLSGDVFEVEGRADLYAATGAVELPGGAGTAKIEDFSSKLEGTTSASLEEIGPRLGRWDIQSAFAVRTAKNGVKMNTKIHFEMKAPP
ncbi:MAG: hypothetical protein U0414_28080 [Polyangiaceae bacterium]